MNLYLRSVTLTEDFPEPPEQTVLLTQITGWGVSFRRCADGFWYTGGQNPSRLSWKSLVAGMEDLEVFLLGPEHGVLNVKVTA